MRDNSYFLMGFPGQYYDQETGIHYNYFRYYNPQTGRYITPDPIGLEGGINLFAYVANNPLIRLDMFGLREPFLGTELDPGYLPSYDDSGLEAIAEGTRLEIESGYYNCLLN
jgi:RHS repeat-associated protein